MRKERGKRVGRGEEGREKKKGGGRYSGALRRKTAGGGGKGEKELGGVEAWH